MKNEYAQSGTITYGIHQVDEIAQMLWSLKEQCAVFTFVGSLGAGKTTLVRSLLKHAGVEGVIASPTFTYVNAYINKQGDHLYHFDCYRIAACNDFVQAGFDEYLYQPRSWCFIEWPEVIMPLLNHRVCHVAIDYLDVDKRVLTYRIVN
jgi:tRNA threonylcarbamoyladenosine biosynthesis protein TsaE